LVEALERQLKEGPEAEPDVITDRRYKLIFVRSVLSQKRTIERIAQGSAEKRQAAVAMWTSIASVIVAGGALIVSIVDWGRDAGGDGRRLTAIYPICSIPAACAAQNQDIEFPFSRFRVVNTPYMRYHGLR
jgi:hypothetical protein